MSPKSRLPSDSMPSATPPSPESFHRKPSTIPSAAPSATPPSPKTSPRASPLSQSPLSLLLICCRHTAFYAAIGLWTLLFIPLMTAALPLPQRYTFTLSTFFCRGLVVFMAWFLGITHRLSGLEHLPTGGYILACKHQSTWETLALMTILPHPAFVLKAELMRIPLVGSLLKKLGMIPVARKGSRRPSPPITDAPASTQDPHTATHGSTPSSDPHTATHGSAPSSDPHTSAAATPDPSSSHTSAAILDKEHRPAPLSEFLSQAHYVACTQHRPLIIFPEGTRTAPDQEVPLRMGVALLAQHTQLPVVPVALNSGVLWPRRRFFKHPGVIDVVFLAPLDTTLPPKILLKSLQKALTEACATLPQ